jgi:photosystem II stability/assembly factor-like uncharacterized protein
VFAATRHTLYESSDGGGSWQERFRVPGQATVSGIAVKTTGQPSILVATDQGLYGSFDEGGQWSRVFRSAGEGEVDCTYVAFHPSQQGTALLATRGGLFISSDHGWHWKEVGVPHAARDVAHFAFDPQDQDRLYLITTTGLFIGNVATGTWQQRLSVFRAEETEVEGSEGIEAHEENDSLHHLSAIAVDPQKPPILYLATSRGLETSPDGGITWQQLTRIGLGSTAISRIVLQAHSPITIYAATTRGVALYTPERWTITTQGLATTQVNDLASTQTQLWAATDEGLYRYQVSPEEFGESQPPSPHELLANFSHEPTIAEVREAAIRYAEVHPDKIRRWRRQAALQALLPSVDVGIDRDRSRDISIDEGGFPNFQLIETKERDSSVDFSVTWDLGELIWSDDQTSIDVRSKLMVQLRDDLVDEVTRTYFERRRLQAMLLTSPPSDHQTILEKELRLQELTALIDGLTGGYFSTQVQVNGNQ